MSPKIDNMNGYSHECPTDPLNRLEDKDYEGILPERRLKYYKRTLRRLHKVAKELKSFG